MADACQIFLSVIQGKHYRTLSTNANVEKYSAVLKTLGIGTEGKACYICVNKLNRIVNLESDILLKQQKCEHDCQVIYSELLRMPGVKPIHNPTSPAAFGAPVNKPCLKRQRTPQTSTFTPKSKRSLFVTPPRLARSYNQQPTSGSGIKISTGTQTKTCVEDFDVKVTVKYKGQERSRIVTKDFEKNVVKCILNNSGSSALIKNIKKSYKQEMIKSVTQEIMKEVEELVRNRSVLLKFCKTSDMLNFSWTTIAEKLKQKVPVLFEVLNNIILNKKKKSMYLLTAISVLLYGRSNRLNLMQFIFGLVFQKNGLSKQGMEILHDLGLSVSYSSIQKRKKDLIKEQERKIEETVTSYVDARKSGACDKIPIEILGDNLDITVNPTKMTMEKQRKSLHWFLIMAKQKRVTYKDIHVADAQLHVSKIPLEEATTASWVPSVAVVQNLESDIQYHISKVLVKYINFIKDNIKHYPECLQHNYLHLTEKKSVVINCDLVEESENSSQGMITILQKVHQLAVPHIERRIVEKVVFGGDVLTNERAFSAQEAMQNNQSEFDNLLGVTQRPEGLHREMNFLMGIYQLFYKEASSNDRGSLYRLRNLVNRRDVCGGPKEVISKFRPHHQFIEDVCDAYIVAGFLDLMDMESEDSVPANKPVFSIMNDTQKDDWLNNVSAQVADSLGLHFTGLDDLRNDLQALDTDDAQVELMKLNDSYVCALCAKQYRSKEWFRKHLSKKHQWDFHNTEHNDLPPENAVRQFMLMALLYRDTCDSFQTGDGNRIVRNCYFEWLYAATLKHYKYKIWLWRFITYIANLLSPEESFEYKWNLTVNLQGGKRSNIPNDNCVEIQVNNIKKLIERQGANKSVQSARETCLVTQVLDSVQTQLMKSTKTVKAGTSRPPVDKSGDIKRMVKCLRDQSLIKDLQWRSFSTFIDPLKCISATDLHSWINVQRKIAALLMK